MKFVDLTGLKFNKLTVIKYVGKDKWGNAKWLCRCDCDKTKIVLGLSLKTGNTKSCGCSSSEMISKKITKHGMSNSKTYHVWEAMIQRCTNPKCKAYKNYGERGIKVCRRWSNKKNGFENFYADMGNPPKGMSLDRIDNDGDYCAKNCRWATRKEQARNQRKNLLITFNGKTQCLSAWAEEYKIPYDVLYDRIIIKKWPIKRALTTCVGKYIKKI